MEARQDNCCPADQITVYRSRQAGVDPAGASAAPGVPGPFSVYLVTSLPNPERLGFARPSVCAPLRATISMSPRPMR